MQLKNIINGGSDDMRARTVQAMILYDRTMHYCRFSGRYNAVKELEQLGSDMLGGIPKCMIGSYLDYHLRPAPPAAELDLGSRLEAYWNSLATGSATHAIIGLLTCGDLRHVFDVIKSAANGKTSVETATEANAVLRAVDAAVRMCTDVRRDMEVFQRDDIERLNGDDEHFVLHEPLCLSMFHDTAWLRKQLTSALMTGSNRLISIRGFRLGKRHVSNTAFVTPLVNARRRPNGVDVVFGGGASYVKTGDFKDFNGAALGAMGVTIRVYFYEVNWLCDRDVSGTVAAEEYLTHDVDFSNEQLRRLFPHLARTYVTSLAVDRARK